MLSGAERWREGCCFALSLPGIPAPSRVSSRLGALYQHLSPLCTHRGLLAELRACFPAESQAVLLGPACLPPMAASPTLSSEHISVCQSGLSVCSSCPRVQPSGRIKASQMMCHPPEMRCPWAAPGLQAPSPEGSWAHRHAGHPCTFCCGRRHPMGLSPQEQGPF